MRRGTVTALLAGLAVLALVACGSGSGSYEGESGKSIDALPASLVPAEINGLATNRESVKKSLEALRRSYVDATSLYSFRSGDVLQATLQVSRFSSSAEPEKETFRDSVVERIGLVVPRPVKVGNETVYLTAAKRQNISVWFHDRYLFVLAVREEYARPRTLLRSVLGLQP